MFTSIIKRYTVHILFLVVTFALCVRANAAILNPFEYILLNDASCGEGGYENCLNGQSNFFAKYPGKYTSKELMYNAQITAITDPMGSDRLGAFDIPRKDYIALVFGLGNPIQLKDEESFTMTRRNHPNEFVTNTPFVYLNRYNEPISSYYASLSVNGVEKSLDDLWGIVDLPDIPYVDALSTGFNRHPNIFITVYGINEDGWIYGYGYGGQFLLAPTEQVRALSAPIPEPQTYAMMIASIFVLSALHHKRLRIIK